MANKGFSHKLDLKGRYTQRDHAFFPIVRLFQAHHLDLEWLQGSAAVTRGAPGLGMHPPFGVARSGTRRSCLGRPDKCPVDANRNRIRRGAVADEQPAGAKRCKGQLSRPDDARDAASPASRTHNVAYTMPRCRPSLFSRSIRRGLCTGPGSGDQRSLGLANGARSRHRLADPSDAYVAIFVEGRRPRPRLLSKRSAHRLERSGRDLWGGRGDYRRSCDGSATIGRFG